MAEAVHAWVLRAWVLRFSVVPDAVFLRVAEMSAVVPGVFPPVAAAARKSAESDFRRAVSAERRVFARFCVRPNYRFCRRQLSI